MSLTPIMAKVWRKRGPEYAVFLESEHLQHVNYKPGRTCTEQQPLEQGKQAEGNKHKKLKLGPLGQFLKFGLLLLHGIHVKCYWKEWPWGKFYVQ